MSKQGQGPFHTMCQIASYNLVTKRSEQRTCPEDHGSHWDELLVSQGLGGVRVSATQQLCRHCRVTVSRRPSLLHLHGDLKR